jgi:hypothetical protein
MVYLICSLTANRKRRLRLEILRYITEQLDLSDLLNKILHVGCVKYIINRKMNVRQDDPSLG